MRPRIDQADREEPPAPAAQRAPPEPEWEVVAPEVEEARVLPAARLRNVLSAAIAARFLMDAAAPSRAVLHLVALALANNVEWRHRIDAVA
jgi:hypothetical protein